MKKTEIADKIVQAFEEDFAGRRGLRQEWEQIDEDVKKEIRETWRRLVFRQLLKVNTSGRRKQKAMEP